MTSSSVAAPVGQRRQVKFDTWDDLCRDFERLAAGGARTVGGWTDAQIITHCAIVMEMALDGFNFSAPAPLRWLGGLLKKRFLKNGFKPGLKARGGLRNFMPTDDVTLPEAVARMRRVIERVAAGERFTRPSPLFGPLTHEEWVTLHLRHCELHYSFAYPAA